MPHASVMPAPRSWTRIVMAVVSGPGSMISRLTWGTLPPSSSRSTTADLVDADDAVGVAEAEVHDGAIGMATERRPAGRLRHGRRPRPCRPGPRSCRRRRSADIVDRAVAGVGEDQLVVERCHGRRRAPARSNGCRCRSSRPVTVGVEQGHPRGVTVRRLGDEQPVGADPAPAIAQLPRQRAIDRSRRRRGASSSTRKSLPRAWCFVRRDRRHRGVGGARRGLPEPLRPPDRVRRRPSVRGDRDGTIGPVGRRTGGCG